jgi:peptide/nickel transport system permease protein
MDPNTTPGFNVPFMMGVIAHAALPFLSLQIAGFGGPALAMRGNSIQVLGSDYIRVAQLRGLSGARIATRYVSRNAILPLYTGFMIGIASMFAGSVILEEIFAYPGVGYYLVRAFESRDYPLMMASFILLAAVTIVGILIADLTYGLIDPRIQTGEKRESF